MPKQPWVKTVWILTALVVIGIVAVGALTFSYIGERNSSEAKSKALQAEKQNLKIAQCVNNVLALRQKPSTADSSAYQAIFAAINNVIIATPGAPQQAAFITFEKTLSENEVILNEDQAFRTAHPLGQC